MNILKSKLLWTIVSIIALAAVFVMFMPKPIDMNLDKVGKGQNAVVFVYDPNLAVSLEQASEMNKARKIVGGEAIFLVAKIGYPESDAFNDRYKAISPDLLFFNGQGQLFERQVALLSAEELVKKISQIK